MWQTADLFQRRVGTDQDIILVRRREAEEP